jgi:hypothetical protein
MYLTGTDKSWTSLDCTLCTYIEQIYRINTTKAIQRDILKNTIYKAEL